MVLVLNRASAEAVASLGPFDTRVEQVTSVLDVARYPERGPRSGPSEPLRAIFVGALTEAKGVFRIVEIAEACPQVRVRLVGGVDDAIRARLERHLREKHLEERVGIEGPIPHADVLRLMGESDVLIFPTTHPEGFPLAVAESMAMGLAVVSSPVGAIPEMAEHDRGGFILPADDHDAYARALARLREDATLLEGMGEFNRKKARERYDWKPVAAEMGRLYEKVMRSGGDSPRAALP